MPGKKKKYNARFPPARIKKIMQSDEDVGKVAAAVPVIISRALELFAETLLMRANDVTTKSGARTLTTSHLKFCIESEKRFDFLRELVREVPELPLGEDQLKMATTPADIGSMLQRQTSQHEERSKRREVEKQDPDFNPDDRHGRALTDSRTKDARVPGRPRGRPPKVSDSGNGRYKRQKVRYLEDNPELREKVDSVSEGDEESGSPLDDSPDENTETERRHEVNGGQEAGGRLQVPAQLSKVSYHRSLSVPVLPHHHVSNGNSLFSVSTVAGSSGAGVASFSQSTASGHLFLQRQRSVIVSTCSPLLAPTSHTSRSDINNEFPESNGEMKDGQPVDQPRIDTGSHSFIRSLHSATSAHSQKPYHQLKVKLPGGAGSFARSSSASPLTGPTNHTLAFSQPSILQQPIKAQSQSTILSSEHSQPSHMTVSCSPLRLNVASTNTQDEFVKKKAEASTSLRLNIAPNVQDEFVIKKAEASPSMVNKRPMASEVVSNSPSRVLQPQIPHHRLVENGYILGVPYSKLDVIDEDYDS